MSIEKWIADRNTDRFIIEDSDGTTLYDARCTDREPAGYIMESLIIDIYTWHDVVVLAI